MSKKTDRPINTDLLLEGQFGWIPLSDEHLKSSLGENARTVVEFLVSYYEDGRSKGRRRNRRRRRPITKQFEEIRHA